MNHWSEFGNVSAVVRLAAQAGPWNRWPVASASCERWLRLAAVSLAGPAASQVDIDARGNLAGTASVAETSGVTAPVFSESVVRDELGRITQRTETIGAGAPATYGYVYDPAGRLTEVTLGGLAHETYGYDESDGLISRGNGVLGTWTRTDGHGRPVELADGTELEWNADGELLSTTAPSGAETEFGYDGFGRLVEVTLPDGRIGRYRYDALGRRSAVRLDGTLIRRFVYGGAEFPRARVDAGGDVLERYVYASQAHVPELIVRRDGQRLRLITDALGSVRAVVDIDTGQIVQRLAYDAYGRTTQDTAPGTQPFGYKGSVTDPVADEAGLVWMGVRAFVPQIARFATVDSIGLVSGWNQHDALGGDPVNRIDPDGRFALPLIAVGVVAGYGLLFPESTADDWTAIATGIVSGLDTLGDAIWTGLDWCADQVSDPSGNDSDASDDGDATPARPEGVPDDWVPRPADNGNGTVWQKPGAKGNESTMRDMGPTARYPNGYTRWTNEHGQPVDPDGKPGPQSDTHLPKGSRPPSNWP